MMKNWIILTSSLFTGLLLVYSTFAKPSRPGEQIKSPGQNKQLVQRLFGEVFNQKSLSVIDELYDPNVIDHSAFPDQAPGVVGIKSAIKGFLDIFDDLEITVEDILAEGDKVVTRETWSVTHKPSGKTAEGSVIHIFRIREGRITDEWSRGWDWLENL